MLQHSRFCFNHIGKEADVDMEALGLTMVTTENKVEQYKNDGTPWYKRRSPNGSGKSSRNGSARASRANSARGSPQGSPIRTRHGGGTPEEDSPRSGVPMTHREHTVSSSNKTREASPKLSRPPMPDKKVEER